MRVPEFPVSTGAKPRQVRIHPEEERTRVVSANAQGTVSVTVGAPAAAHRLC